MLYCLTCAPAAVLAAVHESAASPGRRTTTSYRTPAPAERPGPHSPKEVIPLNSYELMLILRYDAEDQTRTQILDRVRDIITSDGGLVSKVDEWGKRRFAYEIDKMNDGYYYVLYFEAETKTLDEVTRVLKIVDEVVRFMPVRLEETKKVAAAAAEIEGE